MKSLFLLWVVGGLLISCGGTVEKDNNDNPKGGQKLTQKDFRQMQVLMGAIGDLNAITMDLMSSGSIQGYAQRPQQRQSLRTSLQMKRCQTTSQGQLSSDAYSLRMMGGRCPVEWKYAQSREIRRFGAQRHAEYVDLESRFEVKGSGVRSDLLLNSSTGEYTYENRRDSEHNLYLQKLVSETRGRSAGSSQFTYKLNEDYQVLQEVNSSQSRTTYERTETFSVKSGIELVIKKRWIMENRRLLASDFEVNGEEVQESMYNELMQGMDQSVSLSVFAKQTGHPVPQQ